MSRVEDDAYIPVARVTVNCQNMFSLNKQLVTLILPGLGEGRTSPPEFGVGDVNATCLPDVLKFQAPDRSKSKHQHISTKKSVTFP